MTQICYQNATWQVIVLSLLAAHLAAWLFNALIDRIDHDGYTWLLVVIGVAFTGIAASFVIPWQMILILAGYFVVTGIPMGAGDIIRTRRRQKAAQQAALEEARQTMNGTGHE